MKNKKDSLRYIEVGQKMDKNTGNEWTNRLIIATPSTGLVRMEWVLARFRQIIPTNWSQVEIVQWINGYVALGYILADAENLIAKTVVEGNYEWFLSIEQDNVIPPNAFQLLNEYMTSRKVPVVSGLYFTKSVPPEPLIYRGRGTGSFREWKLGDKVWCDGVPFGFCLIHGSIIKALWNESEEYRIGEHITRKVFAHPVPFIGNNSNEVRYTLTRGTTDLEFCTRLIKDKIFEKAGWPEFQKMKHPFLVDTNIFVQHVDEAGRMYPLGGVPLANKPPKNYKPRELK